MARMTIALDLVLDDQASQGKGWLYQMYCQARVQIQDSPGQLHPDKYIWLTTVSVSRPGLLNLAAVNLTSILINILLSYDSEIKSLS